MNLSAMNKAMGGGGMSERLSREELDKISARAKTAREALMWLIRNYGNAMARRQYHQVEAPMNDVPALLAHIAALEKENAILREMRDEPWNPTEILRQWLLDHGYDGLTNDGDCVCTLEEFAICGFAAGCEPAYRYPCEGDACEYSCASGPADFCMRTEKPAALGKEATR